MKSLELQLFRTRVARRVFGLFVLAALLPVTATGVLALNQIGQALTGAADQQLRHASRGYGQAIYRRLVASDEVLTQLTQRLDDQADFSGEQWYQFDAISHLEAGVLTPVFGEFRLSGLESFEGLTRRRSSLLLAEGLDGVDVLLVRPDMSEGFLIGKVSAQYLWDRYTLPNDQEICVLAATVAYPLFCTAELPATETRILMDSAVTATGQPTWNHDGRTYRSAHWDLFTPSGFDGDLWRIVAYVDDAVALASLISFKRLFPIVVLISFITVILLSIWQIRRSMVPLDELVEGTRRIAQRKFDEPVALQGDDEFGDLARALNDMADRLGRQFVALNTLAEIDRLILSAGDLEQVLQTALSQTRAILPCEAAGIVLLDKESPDLGHLYYLAHDKVSEGVVSSRVPTAEIDRTRIQRHPRSKFLRTAKLKLLSAFSESGLSHALVFPISTNEALTGALIFGFRNPTLQAKEGWQSGHDLADRLAVAMSASERETILFNQAHFDPLTGLPNRQLCRDRLHQALAQARRNDHELAVLFLDLDGFKTINDSMGHSAGDILLREAASRLLACVRDTDTVARLGGDEFVVILPQVAGSIEIESVAKKIMATLRRPAEILGKDVFVTVSIGVTTYPADGDTVESLLRKADAAMYDAKSAGRARYVFFTNEIEERATERLSLETDLRIALEQGQLLLRYQPQLQLVTEDVICAEVLARWTHPERGPMSPDLFIPMLEEMGLIDDVGDWVLSTAVKQLRIWQSEGLPLNKIAVNVSARQLRQKNFAERYACALFGSRDHRECVPRGHGSDEQESARAARDGRADLHRRFRHRLLVVQLSTRSAVRRG